MRIIGKSIIDVGKTISTQDVLLKKVKNSAESEGVVCFSTHQSSGRGRGNNKWESQPGKNIAMSFLLFPGNVPAERQFLIVKAVSLGVARFIENCSGLLVKIKWPNDIYVGNNKICGMLVDHSLFNDKIYNSLIGIGINVNQITFEDAPNPLSLRQITGKEYDIKKLIETLCEDLDYFYSMIKKSDFDYLDDEYKYRLYRMGEKSGFIYNSKKIKATIRGVNESGNLIIEKTNGELIQCAYDEIKFII